MDSLFCPTSPCLVFTPFLSSSSLGVPTHPPPGAYEPTLGHTQFPDQVELVVLGWEVLKLGCPSRAVLGMAPVEPGPQSLGVQLWDGSVFLTHGKHRPPWQHSEKPFSPPSGPRRIPWRSREPRRARRPRCQGKDLASNSKTGCQHPQESLLWGSLCQLTSG